MAKKTVKTTPRPVRETPVKDSARVDVYVPKSVWERLKAKAKKQGKAGGRYLAELAAEDVGKDKV